MCREAWSASRDRMVRVDSGGGGMRSVGTVLFLVVPATLVTTGARRWRIPAPSLLVVGGLVVALPPGNPEIRVSPEVIGLVVLPPLLHAGAEELSWRELRLVWKPVSVLAVGLVLSSAAAVGVTASLITPHPHRGSRRRNGGADPTQDRGPGTGDRDRPGDPVRHLRAGGGGARFGRAGGRRDPRHRAPAVGPAALGRRPAGRGAVDPGPGGRRKPPGPAAARTRAHDVRGGPHPRRPGLRPTSKRCRMCGGPPSARSAGPDSNTLTTAWRRPNSSGSTTNTTSATPPAGTSSAPWTWRRHGCAWRAAPCAVRRERTGS